MTEALPPPVMAAERLKVVFRSRAGDVVALEDLSATLRRGEFVSVLGPSGCGKSTLLRVAAGLLQATSGRILLDGTPVSAPRPDVGVVFQQPTLLPWATVLDNVLLPIRTLRRDRAKGRARAEDLLRLVGLENFARHYPGELSGGMQQRVGIARGLVHEPKILLMDEPFAALDAMTREHMMLELQRIWRATGASIVFITHSIPEAVFLSDRVVVLSARPGRVVRDLEVDLPRPRDLATMAEPRFAALCNELRTLFQDLVHFAA
jgi:NitT/TauT family transport system ATP-binding protein